jgi:hypothetical protein
MNSRKNQKSKETKFYNKGPLFKNRNGSKFLQDFKTTHF